MAEAEATTSTQCEQLSDKVIIIIEQVNVNNINQTFNHDCAICLEEFDDDGMENNNIVTLACGHKFHHGCMYGVVVSQLENNSNVTCSVCRLNVMNNAHDAYVDARTIVVQNTPTNEPLTVQEQTWIFCAILGRFLVLILIFAICIMLVGLLLLFIL